ncbi:MAG TPA: sigma-70 family RNA polymerase sigma factor [Candidatus Baltobacteraceae bacterium]|jgi:RNA polymerase sigma-70 factor (ECF subfamily)|nr:sigma-70 family RNA polymerase sigma factor [Candidatus Baltobacteraceae bacterium]
MRLTVPPEMVEAARLGQRDAVERLLEALWPHAFRIARSIVQDDSHAKDAAQEASAIIYREIASLRSADAFRSWAYRIVVREAIRAAKRNQIPAQRAERREIDIDARLDVLRALARLSPELRAVIVLHYYARLSSSEMGSVLGIPGATVRFRLVRARQQLKDTLNPDSAFLTTETAG